MHGKYLNTGMFTSPSVIISLLHSSSSRINHLGTVNVEHKVLSHLFSPFSPFKFFPQAAQPYSPPSSGYPRADMSVCVTSCLPLRGDEGRKERFSDLQ